VFTSPYVKKKVEYQWKVSGHFNVQAEDTFCTLVIEDFLATPDLPNKMFLPDGA
jgi:hypothetical protein